MRILKENCENRTLAEFLSPRVIAGHRFFDLSELPPELLAALRERYNPSAIGHVKSEVRTITKFYQFIANEFIRLVNLLHG